MATKDEMRARVLSYVTDNKETAIRLANELLSDVGKSHAKDHGEALEFFKSWIDEIDDDWLAQVYASVKLSGTFSDPFCNKGQGR